MHGSVHSAGKQNLASMKFFLQTKLVTRANPLSQARAGSVPSRAVFSCCVQPANAQVLRGEATLGRLSHHVAREPLTESACGGCPKGQKRSEKGGGKRPRRFAAPYIYKVFGDVRTRIPKGELHSRIRFTTASTAPFSPSFSL